MSLATYSVVAIRKGREKDYSDFTKRDLQTNASGEELHSDLVGFTVSVLAKSKQEPVSLVRIMHPGLSIDTEATQRLG